MPFKQGPPPGWLDYAGHKGARDLILRGLVDIIEAIQYDTAQRVKAVVEEEHPTALNRTFSEYGLFPWDPKHGALRWPTPLRAAVKRSYDC